MHGKKAFYILVNIGVILTLKISGVQKIMLLNNLGALKYRRMIMSA